MNISKLLYLPILILIMISCNQSRNAIRSVDAATFRSEIEANGPVQLLDVRTPEEYQAGHISGAILIDVNDTSFLEKATHELQPDRPVYLYCRSGTRSMKAAELLTTKGFHVVNLRGGYLAYSKLQSPNNI